MLTRLHARLALSLSPLSRRDTQLNAELFSLTYGSLIIQLIKDYESYPAVNAQLDKMGFNIGTRLIEDLLARTGGGRCKDWPETGEWIAKVCISLSVCVCPYS